MTAILTTLIVVLFGAIFYFNIQFYKDKELFKIKLEILQNSIVEINNKQKSLSNQMKIIDNFDENLKKNKEVLPNALLNFNLELLIILDRNNLIK